MAEGEPHVKINKQNSLEKRKLMCLNPSLTQQKDSTKACKLGVLEMPVFHGIPELVIYCASWYLSVKMYEWQPSHEHLVFKASHHWLWLFYILDAIARYLMLGVLQMAVSGTLPAL